MSEIKFRGMDFTGEWHYGFVVAGNEDAAILPKTKEGSVDMRITFVVKKNTVGQYTGLHDKYGAEIYEGDIVEMWRRKKNCRKSTLTKHVVTQYLACDWKLKPLDSSLPNYSLMGFTDSDSYMLQVVGNIYEKENE